ncbi:MAG: hypothetical protein ACHREM_27420, partial [Polyangiales bacterium]
MALHRRTRAIALPVLLAIVAVSACKKPSDAPAIVDAGPEPLAPETSVPAPAGLALEGSLRSLDALIAVARAVYPLAPETARPLLSELFAIDDTTATQIVTTEPVHFVASTDGAEVSYAYAIPLRDPRATRDALKAGGLVATDDPAMELTTFVSKPDAPPTR